MANTVLALEEVAKGDKAAAKKLRKVIRAGMRAFDNCFTEALVESMHQRRDVIAAQVLNDAFEQEKDT